MSNYNQLLSETLDRIRDKKDIEEMFRSCKAEGQQAMAREILLLIMARHMGFGEARVVLTANPRLIIPYIFRLIKITVTR